MDVLAFVLLGAFCLYQILPLVLAFRGTAAWWLIAQVCFSLSMLALAYIQYDGRSSWVLTAATGVTLAVTTVLSVLLALAGIHCRKRKSAPVSE